MKITIISNLYSPHVRGGYEMGCAELAQAAARLGHDVEVLTSIAPGRLALAPQPPAVPGLTVHRVFEPLFDYEPQPQLSGAPGWDERRQRVFARSVPGNVAVLLQHLQTRRPEAVWAFNLMGLGTLGMVEALAGCGLPCAIHHMDSLDRAFASHPAWSARFVRAKRKLHAISCSHFTRTENEILGLYASHTVIPNGVHFTPTADTPAVVRELEGPYRFVYFGQVEPGKAVLELLEAVVHLRQLAPSRAFTLAVYGPVRPVAYHEQLREFIAKHALESIVTLKGVLPRAQLLAQLRDYDAAVMLLNEHEAFAYSPIEASEAGLPVIFPASSGNGEVLDSSCPLLLATRLDAKKTAEVMAKCVNAPEWASAQGREQRESFRRACDLERAALPACLEVLTSLSPGSETADLLSRLLSASRMDEDYRMYLSTL